MIDGKTRFRPVTGTDEAIQSTQKNPGYVYFASDTGKIYVDLDNENRMAMGGSGVAVLYGKAVKGLEPDEFGGYTLSFDDLEEEVLPKTGDLILNNTDGVFYRVTSVDLEAKTMYCAILAVAGGGSGGGGPSSLAKKIGLKIESLATSNLINGQICYLTYTATSGTESDGSNMDDRLTVSWVISEVVGDSQVDYQKGTIDVNTGVTAQFEFGTKLRDNTTSVITMWAEGLNSGASNKKTQRVTTAELKLTESANFSNLKYYRPDGLTLQCNAIGAMDKILEFYFDDELIDSRDLTANDSNYQEQKVPESKATHGSHVCRMELYQGIRNGSKVTKGLHAGTIEFEVGVVATGNMTPVIWLGNYKEEYYNYDNIQIPYIVYNPASTNSAIVNLKKNGVEIASSPRTIDTSTIKWNYFEITDAQMGLINRYSIGCLDTERSIMFTVIQDPTRKMEYMKTDNIKLSFDAKGRSNAESVANRSYWATEDGSVQAEFTDFNWYNNGWVLDENNNTCLRISNGAQFTIPYGKMTFNANDAALQSNSIEIQFKVRNIQDYSNLIKNTTRYKEDGDFYAEFIKPTQTKYTNYDAFLAYWLPIYPCADESKRKTYDSLEFSHVQKDVSLSKAVCRYVSGSDAAPVGFCLGPQDAFFSNGTNTVNVNYIENDMVYLTMVYSYSSKLMYIYINGVITGVIKSTVNNEFKVENDNIIFNSNFCDIDLYKIRIYNTDLNVNDVVTNHAVDKKDVLIYDQNRLAEENTTINEYQFKYENMIKYNEEHPNEPLMPYIVFDTSEGKSSHGDILPWSKAIEIPIRIEFVNTPLDAAYVSGELETLAIKDGLCVATDDAETKAAAVKTYYKHHCPSFVGDWCEFVVQGTSSEFYPRRNYKIKTKTNYHKKATGVEDKLIHVLLNKGPFQDDYLQDQAKLASKEITYGQESTRQEGWYMNNYTNLTDRWTMKVDYMESSGSYNAGFASMAGSAYSKHPLEDYIAAGAFYDKNNPHEDSEENRKEAVKTLLKSEVTNKLDWSEYRTSLLGFPVLAFHKKSDGSYLYVGMYRMLLDKSSNDVLGFDLPGDIRGAFLGGEKMKDMAECWEFCNNSRGFCSYRDPWNRVELSFKAPADAPEKEALTSAGAPIITDNIEYRYNSNDDWIDMVLDLKSVTTEQSDEFKADGPGFEIMTTEGKEAAREWLLGVYSNWEKVNKWVWSTNTDNVVSQGNYVEIELFRDLYAPGKYFLEQRTEVENEDGTITINTSYALENASATFNADTVYYEQIVGEEGGVTYMPVLVTDNADLVYAPGAFYVYINGAHTPANDAYDSAETYYVLQEDDTYKTKADRLVRPTTDTTYQEGKTYYFYDGSVKIVKVGEAGSLATSVAATNAEEFATALATGKQLYEGITVAYGSKEYEYDTKEYRADKFINELTKHFDPEYLATYFIMTEVFECYDSRGKNCMMASWGPLEEGGDYIWYPIFYDIDTQLGINNTGIPSFEYNVDATEQGNYSTSDSLLWNNFYKYFKNSYILQKYKHLRGVTVGVQWDPLEQPTLKSVDDIESWYNFDSETNKMIATRGVRPLIAKNLDMWWKYITITNNNKTGLAQGITGWLDRDGKYVADNGGTYFYALQGDRSQSRQQFLTSRLEYVDSWLNQGNYQRGGSNNIRGRVAANNPEKTSDLWVHSADHPYWADAQETTKNNKFDAEYWVNLKPIRSSYVTLSDDAAAYPSQKYDGVTPVKFEVTAIKNGVMTSPGYPEQLLYIYGMNQMADLGEMHNLYWQEFDLTGDATHLTTLKLGTDELMEVTDATVAALYDPNKKGTIWTDKNGKQWYKWQNTKMNQPSIPANKDDVFGGMPLLKEVNLCNISVSTGSPVLDFSSCEKLQDFRATGSNFVQFTFADGVALHTLYLPSSITSLELTEANLLTNLLTEYNPPVRDDLGVLKANEGLWIDGIFDGTDATALQTLSLKGGALGYGSYELLAKLYDIRQRKSSTMQVQMTNVDWSPYKLLVEGDRYIPGDADLYYKDDGHMGFTKYTYDALAFETSVLNGEIYKLDPAEAARGNQITSLDMFEDMADSTSIWKGVANGANVPNITGIVYINNPDTDKVDEYEFRNGLAKQYPDLTFFFANVDKAYTAKFIIQEEDGTYVYAETATKTKAIETIKEGWFTNPYTAYTAEKENWDFHGWSLTNDNSGLIGSANSTAEQNANAWGGAGQMFNPDKYDYTFYAVFTIHKWNMTFYKDATNTFTTKDITHGDPITGPTSIPALDESSLPATERYRFLGWSQSPTNLIVSSEASAALVTLESIIASANMEFYAVFIKESVYDATSDLSWFDFTPEYWTHPLTSTTYEGYAVRPKLGRTLSGKITLPSTYDDKPVIICGGFGGHSITHLFWKGEAKLLAYESQALGSVSSLVYIDLPVSLMFIGESAFSSCNSLEMPDLTKCPALDYIADYAFNGAGYHPTGGLTLNLPSTLKHIGFGAFSFMRRIGSGGAIWAQVNLGSSSSPSQLSSVGLGKNFEANTGRNHGNFTAYGITNESLKNEITTYWLGKFTGTISWL